MSAAAIGAVPIPDRAILQTEGDRAQAYRLQGYVFFGSGYPLADRLKQSLNGEPPPKSILLDFEAVSGFDFSAAHALCRFMHAARSEGTRVVLCAAPVQLRHELKRNLPPPVFDNAYFAKDADGGLERCEDILIEDHRKWHDEEAGALLDRVADAMERHLDSQSEFEALVDALGDWSQARYYGPDESIVATDAASAGPSVDETLAAPPCSTTEASVSASSVRAMSSRRVFSANRRSRHLTP